MLVNWKNEVSRIQRKFTGKRQYFNYKDSYQADARRVAQRVGVRVFVCVGVRVCVCACVRPCLRSSVPACVRVFVSHINY